MGSTLKFTHLQYEDTVENFQGAQGAYIGYDELTHFTKKQFTYMFSRLRSDSGVRGRIRGACNPDPDSFVREMLDWWIGEDGFPIQSRSGVIRWFIMQDDQFIWGNSRQELIDKYGKEEMPLSITYIPSTIRDNKIMMANNPNYMAALRGMSRVDRGRLLDGNWNIRATAGSLFQQGWFQVVDHIPEGWVQSIRFWDRAATKPSETNKDPDWTRGLRLLKYPNGKYLIADLKSIRDTPGKVEDLIKNVASFDGYSTSIRSQQDPGSSGVSESENFIRMLSGYDVGTIIMSKDKITRAKPVSAQCEFGNVMVLRAPWNKELFDELENFPEGKHDDQCFVAGTKIATATGDKNIEDISLTDMVFTPFGLRKVLDKRMTGKKRVISTSVLIGTHDHPIFQFGSSFVSLDAIHLSMIDCLTWKSQILWICRRLFFLMESNIGEWEGRDFIILVSQQPIKAGRILKVFMSLFTSFSMTRKFMKVLTSTISMGILLTIQLIIYSYYQKKSIVRHSIITQIKSILIKSGILQAFGINQKKEENGTVTMRNQSCLKTKVLFAWCALLASSESLRRLSIALAGAVKRLFTDKVNLKSKNHVSFAARSSLQKGLEPRLKQKHVQGFAREDSELKEVYNLTVSGYGCYYANGVLVSNCDTLSGAFNELSKGRSILDFVGY